MRINAIALACSFLLLCACTNKKEDAQQPDVPSTVPPPMAILKAGEHPLWFQFGDQGPVLLNSIDEACYSTALIPWPFASHARFILARNDDVYMAINRDGFLAFSPWAGSGAEPPQANGDAIGLYRFSGGDFWQAYTVGAFVFHDEIPAALLYRDDRFLDTGIALPDPRAWAFSMETGGLFKTDIPALRDFPAGEGWDIDALRFSPDAYWYYRAVKKTGAAAIKYMRSRSLDRDGEAVGPGVFLNSALPEKLSLVPPALTSLFAEMKAQGTVIALSPDFSGQRYFSGSPGSMTGSLAYYRIFPFAALAIDIHGKGLLARTSPAAGEPDTATTEHIPLTLPQLPENFIYTGIALCGQTIIAVWEEQEDYNIGAAGFMVLQLP